MSQPMDIGLGGRWALPAGIQTSKIRLSAFCVLKGAQAENGYGSGRGRALLALQKPLAGCPRWRA